MPDRFPFVLSNGPPPDRLQEVADGGASMVRTGLAEWTSAHLEAQIASLHTLTNERHWPGRS